MFTEFTKWVEEKLYSTAKIEEKLSKRNTFEELFNEFNRILDTDKLNTNMSFFEAFAAIVERLKEIAESTTRTPTAGEVFIDKILKISYFKNYLPDTTKLAIERAQDYINDRLYCSKRTKAEFAIWFIGPVRFEIIKDWLKLNQRKIDSCQFEEQMNSGVKYYKMWFTDIKQDEEFRQLSLSKCDLGDISDYGFK